jgi:hypothetical protein
MITMGDRMIQGRLRWPWFAFWLENKSADLFTTN